MKVKVTRTDHWGDKREPFPDGEPIENFSPSIQSLLKAGWNITLTNTYKSGTTRKLEYEVLDD
jgi:hypothetical protein